MQAALSEYRILNISPAAASLRAYDYLQEDGNRVIMLLNEGVNGSLEFKVQLDANGGKTYIYDAVLNKLYAADLHHLSLGRDKVWFWS
ncbi:hypothetical protein SAMN05216431_11925 [Ligilactobacillus sp. WC1T17]|uniref:Glycosyl hydrolase family 30 beta sandwich domain-containing protein n=1 Tax=Ligilactobacillus ruminis TaxID=1623 RepID=A0ABY1AET2_9LACO|nr:hypothetical protein SAMN05216431_11925 [Ligilactobacillus ruminis]